MAATVWMNVGALRHYDVAYRRFWTPAWVQSHEQEPLFGQAIQIWIQDFWNNGMNDKKKNKIF